MIQPKDWVKSNIGTTRKELGKHDQTDSSNHDQLNKAEIESNPRKSRQILRKNDYPLESSKTTYNPENQRITKRKTRWKWWNSSWKYREQVQSSGAGRGQPPRNSKVTSEIEDGELRTVMSVRCSEDTGYFFFSFPFEQRSVQRWESQA